ncbi:MAG: fluoride efflux transporter CrcB [Bdellovibrionales bacterium]|nr:fluoride efflux transporter CrcB [Bdellovibrionales bacterium]
MTDFIWVGLGGMLGSMARYGVSVWIRSFGISSGFPVATLIVNVVGCFGIGFLSGVVERSGGNQIQVFAITGILGGFTTFSAFGLETWSLIQTQQTGWAAMNLALSLVLGLAAVAGGRFLS